MPFTGNTVPYQTEWVKAYQETHYKQPVFPVFADQKFADLLAQGASVKWSYDSDSDVQDLGTDGSYTVEGKTVTDETLTVDQLPSSTFRIPGPQRIQDHRPTQQKWATKAMNRIFWKIDAKVLGQLKSNATSSLSAGDFGGTSGLPITATSTLAGPIFAAARRKLRNTNVIYDENKRWTGYVKLDNAEKFPACAIPAELEEQVLLAVGFKPGDLGDDVLKRGFMNYLFGFNTFVSTALPFTIDYVVASGNATNGDTFTLGGNVFTLVSGTPSAAGEIKIGGSASLTGDNIATALNAPYTSVSGTYSAFTRTSLTLAQRFILDMTSGSNASGTVTVTVLGHGTVSYSDTAASDGWSATTAAVHAIFGTSKSIALILQRYPELMVSGDIIGNGSTGGYVAKDFVTWTLAGWKVFETHKAQLVDVPIAASTFSAPSNSYK